MRNWGKRLVLFLLFTSGCHNPQNGVMADMNVVSPMVDAASADLNPGSDAGVLSFLIVTYPAGPQPGPFTSCIAVSRCCWQGSRFGHNSPLASTTSFAAGPARCWPPPSTKA